jgi:hypothetical protein
LRPQLQKPATATWTEVVEENIVAAAEEEVVNTDAVTEHVNQKH